MIIAKCPLRVSLVGGSTDLESFIQKYGVGSVISFPSSLSVYVTLHINHRNKIIVNYSSKEEVESIEQIKNDIVRVVMNHFRSDLESTKNKLWVTVTFNSDVISHGSGLATSSAYMIATIKAFSLYLQMDLSDFEICKLAIELERQFNPLTGYQDVYGCGIAGFKRIVFENNRKPKFRYFETKFLTDNFDMCLLYTGIQRSSTSVLKSIDIDKAYPLLNLVDKTDESLDSGNVDEFLRIFNQGWITKRQSSPKIFDEIDDFQKFDSLLKESYVIGYKLLGAGAGGYFFLFLCKGTLPKLNQKMKEMNMNHEPIHIQISDAGVKGFIL